MPGPSLLGTGMTYETPPVSIKAQNLELYDYLLVLHQRLFGVDGKGGDQGRDNVNSEALNLHDAPGHGDIAQGVAVEDPPQITAAEPFDSVVADATWGTEERDAFNSLESSLTNFVASYNADLPKLRDVVNNLILSLRNAKVIAS